MLELADDVARLRRELKALRERQAPGDANAGPDDSSMDERPPHY